MVANITTGVDTLPEEIKVDVKLLEKILQQPPLSHSATAIYAADSWASDNSTTRDVYDMIVKTSREVSPMCRSLNPPPPPLPPPRTAERFSPVGSVWSHLGYTGYKWPTRSVERLPPFRHQKLRGQVLVMGNTVDPATPIVSARFVAELLGDQAALVEQLGFGHTTLAESSSCVDSIVANHIMRGIVSHFHPDIRFPLNNSLSVSGFSSRGRRRPSARSTIRVDYYPCCSPWKTTARPRNSWFSVHETREEKVVQWFPLTIHTSDDIHEPSLQHSICTSDRFPNLYIIWRNTSRDIGCGDNG